MVDTSQLNVRCGSLQPLATSSSQPKAVHSALRRWECKMVASPLSKD